MIKAVIRNPGKMIFIGLMVIFILLLPHKAEAAVWDNAVTFYQNYGTGEICFHDGAFYYASRGSAGNDQGIHYAVAGQTFSLGIDENKEYSVTVALDGTSNKGTCKRISYITKGGYRYSLYKVSYNALYKRLQKKYPEEDFSEILYNHKLTIRIDFCLCLSVNDEDQGTIIEKDNGNVEFKGRIYENYKAIVQAENWSERTVEALKGYFGILKTINQPSVYYLVFKKNLSSAQGTMKRQKLIYGKKKKISACSYSASVKVTFVWTDYYETSETLKRDFLGWSRTGNGTVVYADRDTVCSLSKTQGAKIKLYAQWDKAEVTLPLKAEETDPEKKLKLIGWCTDKMDIQPSGTTAETLEHVIVPGERVSCTEDTVFYAVWSYVRRKVIFRTPDTETQPLQIFSYSADELKKLREKLVLYWKGV